MKRITLRELAQALNMSISTVSRALSDHPDISESTKEKVREASALYNYKPNLRARYLRTKSSGLVALILPEYNMFFIPTLMQSISEVVNKHNYSLLVFQSDDSFEKELDIIDYCNQISVDGILLSLSNGFNKDEDLKELSSDNAPIVLLDKVLPNLKMSCVSVEGDEISQRAVSYLRKKGHKHIGGVFADPGISISQNRLKGFTEAIEDYGDLQGYVLSLENVNETDRELTRFLKEFPEITALYVMSDEIAMRVYHCLNKLNVKIPDEVSVISISDGSLPRLLHPNITHFYHSAAEIGKRAAETLFHVLKSKSAEIENISIECQLVELDSVKDLK
ncbi:MAG: LacI family transcriptional regulator [Cytophagales bacterium]|nr:LacI family transcriptional regulator [Cytophagales bacterium]